MSAPNIPNITPVISIDRDDAINLLLSSIAMEELGLSHIINAEGEKIQYVLGKLPGTQPPASPTIDQMLAINESVRQTLDAAMKSEMHLQSKLETIIGLMNAGKGAAGAKGVPGTAGPAIDNLTMPGEDRHFCIRAVALGFKLYVDTRTPAYHLYRSADLEGGYRFIKTHYGTDLRRIRISLCMVVMDDEAAIERCLRSVEGIVDEMIVVDAGSGSRMPEIAAGHGAYVYGFEWNGDCSAAWNYAFEQASMDYILWLDAEDVIEPEDRAKLLELIHFPPDIDSVIMDHHLEWQMDGKPLLSRKRHRLVRHAGGFRWEGAVHAVLEVTGSVLHSAIAISRRRTRPKDGRRLEM